jgi:hypothetical protein
MRDVARQYNPNFMISGNVFGGFGYGPIAYLAAGNMDMLARDGYDDFIYSEMQEYLDSAPRNNDGTKITNSPALKFLTAVAHQKPVIIYATEITPPIFPDPTEKCLSAMSQINIAEAVANHCIFREKRETPQGATDVYEFLAENREYLIGAKLYSNVGILASLNQFLADEQSFAFTTSRVLTDEGINHTFLVEEDLVSSKLNQFEIIILPYLPLMNEKNQNSLLDFVKEGGNLFILGQTGVKNQYNMPNNHIPFLEVNELSAYPEEMLIKTLGKGKIIFMPLEIPQHKFLTVIELKGDATTFGSSMVDVFADVPEAYTRSKIHPELREMLQNVADELKRMYPDKLTLVKNNLPFVELTTMRNDDRYLLVNLVNYNVTIAGDITPAENISVQIFLPEKKKVKRILYNGQLGELSEVKFETSTLKNKNLVYVTFPELSIYGLAIIELEESIRE